MESVLHVFVLSFTMFVCGTCVVNDFLILFLSSCPNADCYESFGENYQGQQSRTRSNLPCAPWRDHSNRSAPATS